MSAIWRGCKQYFVRYESDQRICGEYNHFGGNASTIRSAKAIITNIRKEKMTYNPRNFKVYDSFADVEADTNFVPCVYEAD